MVGQKGQLINIEERLRGEKELGALEPPSFFVESTGVTKQSVLVPIERRNVVSKVEQFPLEALRKGVTRRTEEERIQVQNDVVGAIKINFLWNRNLRMPIDAILERDGEGFIAKTLEIPLYGYGEDSYEAVVALKREIESLYGELAEDDNISEEWLKVRAYLKRIVD